MAKSETKFQQPKFEIAKPYGLSPRSKWLRDYYFLGLKREWINEYMPYSTGLPGDRIWNEVDYYMVPEYYFYIGQKDWGIISRSINLMAQKVDGLSSDFWKKSLPERRMEFLEKVLIDNLPQEIIGPSLIAGGRFNTQLSKCLTKKEQDSFNARNLEIRHKVFDYHNWGFGNGGATGGHLIADYETIIKKGFKFIHEKANKVYNSLSDKDKSGSISKKAPTTFSSIIVANFFQF